ncbi:hypothetical protein HKD37_16G045629 [Glycine soja]
MRLASDIRYARHSARLACLETLEEDQSEMCSRSESFVSSRAQCAQLVKPNFTNSHLAGQSR